MKNHNISNPYNYRNPQIPIPYNDTDSDSDDQHQQQQQTHNLKFPIQNNPNNNNFYNNNSTNNENEEISKRHPKKRKLESFVSNNPPYEFPPPQPRRPDTWTEDETYALLEVWGERYLELGRRSLRSEDWADVSEKVLDMCSVEKSVSECRTQMDVLKNKYKKEKSKVETGLLSSGSSSKWQFFKKMDGLLSTRSRGHCGLGCGVDSGEYVFMNPRVYLDRSNVLDEMRDSPGESDEEGGGDDDEEEEDGDEEEGECGESVKMLADSIARFGEIYEKIEENKRKQMIELETMREEFQRDLEVQKKEIVERAQAEIAKIREMGGDDDDDDEEEEEDTDGDSDADADADASGENRGD